ncbi:MAG: phosphoglycerate dehydrogenase [Candidatus Eremiobacteraeota bacterium]|nr:phosphoglycerate dehydrogenase [Candidatus Eremiobacteraeota bacterium]
MERRADVMVTLSLFDTIEGREAQLARLETAGYSVRVHSVPRSLSEEEVAAFLPGVRAWIAGTDRFSRKALAAADRLEVISRWGVGYDAVDVAACDERGIAVAIAAGGNDGAVAEFALAMVFALARQVVWAHDVIRERTWERTRIGGISPLGKILGIVGLGRIGLRLARLALALGMHVQYYDPLGAVAPNDLEARFTSIDELLATSDFISLHVPLSAQTEHLISTRELNLMKPTAYLVNTSRGPVIDEAALYAALRDRRIGGAALDVFEKEPIDPNHPLFRIESQRLILTPHIAGLNAESKTAMLRIAVDNVLAVLGGKLPPSVVNRPRRAAIS